MPKFPGFAPVLPARNQPGKSRVPEWEQKEGAMTPTPRTAFFAILGLAALAGSGLAQDKGDAAPKRTVAPPQTTGQAPLPAPTGHRQPTARDVPQEPKEAPVSPAQQDLDRRLNICRGC
jgi:hypothetical protein